MSDGSEALPDVEKGLPVPLESACDCGDCFRPLIGLNTDGEPCDWCQDCGCSSASHDRMVYLCMVPGCDQTAVELVANDAVCTSPEYAERWVCRWHKSNPFGGTCDLPPGGGRA